MIVDTLSHHALYAATPLLARAFDWLTATDLRALPDGRIEIEPGELAAIVQSYVTKPRSEGRLEAHRRFIDIQYVIDGEERMGWAPLADLSPDGEFDEGSDVGFYGGAGELVSVKAGSFAVFFPHDAHMPCISPAGGPCAVKKVVVKVKGRGVSQ